MFKKHVLTALILCLTAVAFAGAAQADVISDFVKFDQAFIPPLALTNAEKVGPSTKGMKILKAAFTDLKSSQDNAFPDDPAWKTDFDRIEAIIAKADQIVLSKKDLMDAHEALEEVRHITLDMRTRHNIQYFMDPLTRFHTLMEELFHAGLDNKPEDLDDTMLAGLADTAQEASEVWAAVGQFPFDPQVYGLGPKKTEAMKELYQKEAQALDNMEKALAAKDKAAVIAAAKGVKPNYANYYKLFGDFDRIMN